MAASLEGNSILVAAQLDQRCDVLCRQSTEGKKCVFQTTLTVKNWPLNPLTMSVMFTSHGMQVFVLPPLYTFASRFDDPPAGCKNCLSNLVDLDSLVRPWCKQRTSYAFPIFVGYPSPFPISSCCSNKSVIFICWLDRSMSIWRPVVTY